MKEKVYLFHVFHVKYVHKTFSSERNIPHHISSVHEGKKYACTSCGKKLSDEGSLNRHINLIHGKSSKFNCQYKNCDYVTNYKHQLLANQSIHDKNMGFIYERNISIGKNYKCDICEKTFSTTKGLKNHYKKH